MISAQVPHGLQVRHQLPATHCGARRRPGQGHARLLHDLQLHCASAAHLAQIVWLQFAFAPIWGEHGGRGQSQYIIELNRTNHWRTWRRPFASTLLTSTLPSRDKETRAFGRLSGADADMLRLPHKLAMAGYNCACHSQTPPPPRWVPKHCEAHGVLRNTFVHHPCFGAKT